MRCHSFSLFIEAPIEEVAEWCDDHALEPRIWSAALIALPGQKMPDTTSHYVVLFTSDDVRAVLFKLRFADFVRYHTATE